MTQEELNATLKSKFEEAQFLTAEHKEKIAEGAKKIFELRKTKVPIDTKFVTNEFSRFKVVLLKDNTIIINELKEEDAKRLFDSICQST